MSHYSEQDKAIITDAALRALEGLAESVGQHKLTADVAASLALDIGEAFLIEVQLRL